MAVVVGSYVEIVGEGTSAITGSLEGTPANGTISLTGYPAPETAAVAPTVPAGDVISMFSDVYTDVPVDSWNTGWAPTQTQPYVVDGDNTLMYSNLTFVGIEFFNPMIDASAMTHFHMDVYAPAGTNFKIKLVSFPGGDSLSGVETQDLVLDATTTPSFVAEEWSYLEVPVGDFVLPAGWDWSHIGQLVLSTSNAQLVLVDNVYWHK